jgi:dTMP kinase
MWLSSYKVAHILTREPGGTPLGEKLREIVLDSSMNGISQLSELLLFLAARAEHVDKVITPALSQGAFVLCDRYVDSTMAYQAYARQLGVDFVWNLATSVVPLLPDVTLYLDVSSKLGFERVKKRSSVRDRMEEEKELFHEKVRLGFLDMAKRCPDRIVVLDASLDEESLAKVAQGVLSDRFSIGV